MRSTTELRQHIGLGGATERAYEQSLSTRQGAAGYTPAMSRADTPDRLAEALRANLRRRKERMRAQRDSSEAIDSFGADEEGDVPIGQDRPGAWVHTDTDKS